MVRKKYAPADQRLAAEGPHLPLEDLVENWLARIRACLPDGGTAVATIHKVRRRFLVSFRASAYGETFISEVRKENIEEGIEEAGTHLFERLEQSPPQPKKLREKILGLFSDYPVAS